jgi:hypothetical protein
MIARKWAVAAALAMGLSGAEAKVNMLEADPATWLRQVYDAYVASDRPGATGSEASMALLEARASKSLAALFRQNDACEKKHPGEVCALDFDWVIDGQDSELRRVQVGATKVTGDKATVIVNFVNLREPCTNTYYFVREGGAWKLDDLQIKQGKQAPNGLAKQLRTYSK